jgi:hypothetical protein
LRLRKKIAVNNRGLENWLFQFEGEWELSGNRILRHEKDHTFEYDDKMNCQATLILDLQENLYDLKNIN